MARQCRIGILLLTGSMYYQDVCISIGKAIELRRSWSIRLAGALGGSPTSMLNWRPDGVITNITHHDPFIDKVRSLGIPLVNFSGAMPDGDIPTVRCDDHQIGALAANYLMDRNLRHFAFWTALARTCARRRREAFFATLGERGVPSSCLHTLPSFDVSDWRNRDRTIREWIQRLPKPVGLLAGGDLQAYYLCGICRDASLDVPNEIALLGVDDDRLLCELATPHLSSIQLPAQRLGATAVEILSDLLDGRPAPPEPVLFPPVGVVSRRSTDMLAIDDPDLVAAVRFIREHATEGIAVPDVLAAVPLSRRSLERRFRDIFGRSPAAEIRRVQLERARYLLMGSTSSIPQIARMAGFSSADHFASVYRRETGEPPSQYRHRGERPRPRP